MLVQQTEMEALQARIAELEQENNELRKLAFTDKLTGLHNRASYEIEFDLAWNLAIRQNQNISIAIVDIDFFKRVNDTLGHSGGDRVLETLGYLMNKLFRKSDLCCRSGGEEFTIILPDTDMNGAIKSLNILRQVFTESTKQTLSIGLVSCRPYVGQDKQDIVELADKEVYKAKRSGRDMICSSVI